MLIIGVYAVLPFLIAGEGLDLLPAGARPGLFFAALGAAVASFAARRWWSNSLLAAAASAAGGEMKTDLWVRLRAGCLISWALGEVVAILGCAYAILGQRPVDGLPWSAGALLLLYLHRPAAWPVQALAGRAVPA